MKRIIVALVSSLVAVVAGAVALENNRFVLRQGENYPMLVYDQNADVCFEVRSVGMQGWYVVSASIRGTCYVASATVGEQVLDAAFEHQKRSIDSAPQSVFRFQFLWRYQEYGNPPLEHYGWVTLTIDREGGIVIVASQVADVHGLAVVGECEPGGWKPIDDGEDPDGGDDPSGPDISCDVTLRECEKPTLMRLLGAKTLLNARTVSVRPEFDKEKEIEPQEPLDAARVCVQLGITPVRVEADGQGVCIDAYFRVPKIQIVKFDPAARTVKGRVIPAEGSRIAEPPQEYVFVLHYHYPYGVGGFGIKDIYCPFDERNYALLDLSDYAKTGEFTFTYTEDLIRGDTSCLFSVGISNDYYSEWWD